MKLIRKKRLILVGAIVVVLGGGAGAAVMVRLQMIRHRFAQTRERGLAEYQRGESGRAMGDLGTYLQRYPQDVEALRGYAESRLKIEAPDGSHLSSGIGALRRLADIEQAQGKDVTDLQRRLCDLYLQDGLNMECSLLAAQILARHPDDAAMERDQVLALFRLRKYNDAKTENAKYIALRPHDLEAQVLGLQILTHIGSYPDIVGEAAKVVTAHPDDMRWKVLKSIAYTMVGDAKNALQSAKDAQASGKAPDALTGALETEQLWRTGAVQLGDAWLEQAAAQYTDATVQLMWVRRLFEMNQFAAIERMSPDALTPSTFTDEAAFRNQQANLRGYQALGWVALRQPDKAKAAQQALADDPYSLYAHDWAMVVKHVMDPSSMTQSDWGRNIPVIAQRHPDNGFFQLQLGVYLTSTQNYTGAIKAWEAAAIAEPAWTEPVVLGAQMMLAAQRPAEALNTAREALTRNPEDRDALVIEAMAMAANRAKPADPRELLTLLDTIHKKFPQDQRTLALRVYAQTQVNGKDAGIATLRQTLAIRPTLPLPVLLQLAGISRTSKLGLADECFALAQQTYGLSPDLALTKAQFLADDGHPEQGIALIKDARAKATTDTENWDMAYAQFLEIARDPSAKSEWLALSDKYPGDSRVQWLVLGAPSILADHDATGKTIERLRPLIGAEDFNFKLARARWLLQEKPNQSQVTEATTMLTEMTKGSPDQLTPHVLLATCFELSGNDTGAIEQLEMAAALTPDSTGVLIDLTGLLQRQGNNDKAAIYLKQLTADTSLTDTQRQQVASLLTRAGNPEKAIALMEAGIGPNSGSDDARLLLATLYAERGRSEEAAALLDKLMQQPTLGIIREAAAFYAMHGRMRDASQAMAKLATLKLAPGILQAEQGDFAARFGKPEEAVADYLDSLKADPSNGNVWRALIAFQISTGKAADAQASLDRAVAALPADKVLAGLVQDKPSIAALDDDVRARPILISLLITPQHAAAAHALLARLAQNKSAPTSNTQLAIDVTRLADRYPQFAALQTLAVDLNISAGRLDDAVTIATRAMQAFPASAESARIAAQALALSNRWAETLGASNEWRQRDPSQPLQPDVMIGSSYMGMGRPDDTLKQIQPYLASAQGDPENYAGVITLYARAELAKGRPAAAEERIWPFAKSSREGMADFLAIAADQAPPEVAKRWFAMAKGELHDDMPLVYAYARDMANAGVRLHDPAYLQMAVNDVTAIIARSKAPPEQLSTAYQALAMLQEAASDPGAEANYRKAVALNPKNDAALNNLAMVLARKGSLDEALKLANQAVAEEPRLPAYQDTLAFVQDKAGDHDGAIEHLRNAIQLEPGNLEWRINLAQIYVNAGQKEKARSTLANSDGTPIRGDQLDAGLRDHLSQLSQQLGIRL
ncbi:MAG TPA: tetratricopeptide repeat protein [Phycisphaerae bacterium]|nr:tetratricopeptide repeat protein [Phycisphaerae bacterium]